MPSPEALLTIGLSVERLTEPALPSHYGMLRAINSRDGGASADSPGDGEPLLEGLRDYLAGRAEEALARLP